MKNKKEIYVSTDIIDRKWIDVNIPCKVACPIMTDIPGYIQAIMTGDYETAYRINRMDNVLPGVLGRVCSRPCEPVCRHGRDGLGDPVSICFLKRSAADFGMQPVKPEIKPYSRKVCIIGSGPAGLTAANDLALRGYRVTVLEQAGQPGGMLRYGIPQFRLPYDVVAADVKSITDLGVTIKTKIRIDDESEIEKLKKEYDAVLLAGGCQVPKAVNIPGIDGAGVYWGLDFMIAANIERVAPAADDATKRDSSQKQLRLETKVSSNNSMEGSATPADDVTKQDSSQKQLRLATKVSSNNSMERSETEPGMEKVVVIGGGFTAVDCTRMAHRLGAKEVTLSYRRTKDDMYVSSHEVDAMQAEGIRLTFLVSPVSIENKDGKVTGIRFIHNRINKKDRSITAIEGSEFLLEADTVIFATGQKAEDNIITEDSRETANNFFIAGDFRNGASTVIEAAADGRRAGRKIHKFLSGIEGYRDVVKIEEVKETGRQRDDDFIPRQPMPETPLHERQIKDKEVELGFSKERSLIEARRCYLCHYNFQIDIDLCIYCLACIDVMPVNCIKMAKDIRIGDDGNLDYVETKRWDEVQAITIDNDECIRCGNCVRACPVDCISISKYTLDVNVVVPAGGQTFEKV